jgi:LDH2 family malate/lactate/ureidoglycolate dehydrogenase
MDAGFKGFGLGLLVEMLTSGLAGHGRADTPQNWGASVYLQLIDPDGFGDKEHLKKQSQYFVKYLKSCDPINPEKLVRIPGERAFSLKSRLKLESQTISNLEKWAAKLDVPTPFL